MSGNRIGNPETFTAHYRGLANHYGFASGKIQPRSPEENGDVEERHYRLKKAVDQALLLRGSRNLVSRPEYERFLEQMFEQLNAGRQERLREELQVLGRLPARRQGSGPPNQGDVKPAGAASLRWQAASCTGQWARLCGGLMGIPRTRCATCF